MNPIKNLVALAYTEEAKRALLDSAMAKYIKRYPDGNGSLHEPTFELSQEFRDYRTQMRALLNGPVRG